MSYRKRIIVEDIEEGPEWVASYTLNSYELDDAFEETDIEEVSFNAEDFDTAVKYAQQYLRKMKTDENTKDKWNSAEILSVVMH